MDSESTQKSKGTVVVGVLFAIVAIGLFVFMVVLPWRSDRAFRKYVTECVTTGGQLEVKGSVFIGQRLECREEGK